AHLLLNHLTVDTFLGGEMRLNLRLAKEAVHNQIAVPLGLTVEEAAYGIITIANSNMQRILHLVTVDRGYDPRKFILIAYGGAGPLHATDLAEEMDIQTILIPPLPGLFSSLGLLFADMSVNFLKTVMIQLSVKSVKKLNRGLSQLSKQAESFFRRMKVPLSERVIRFSSDLRYYGQNYELNVELPGEKISTSSLNQIRSRFDHTHERVYGYKAPEEPVQTVNLKAKAVWRVPKPEIRRLGTLDCVKKSRPEVQEVFFSQRWLRCAVYSRSTLQQGERIRGPAIIREKEATTLVGEDWHLEVDKMGSLILTRD
ncbi:hydantoinase/oxoprolinase family protein, partial [[Eubacterium] cellulosolvens]